MKPFPHLTNRQLLVLRNVLHTVVVVSMVLSWFIPPVKSASAAAATPAESVTLPDYIYQFQARQLAAAETGPDDGNVPETAVTRPDAIQGDIGTSLLPEWFASPVSEQIQAAASCTPAGNLALTLTLPPYTVSRGNVVGDVYTATLTNFGVVSTTEVSLLINPNVGFNYVGGSATVTSNLKGTLVYTDPGTTAPDANAVLQLSGLITETSLLPGETMIFTFVLATNADAQSAQPLAVSLLSGSPTTESCRTTQENVQTARGNLTILKTPATQDGRVGEPISWTVTLANSGLGNIYDAIFTDTIGAGYTNMAITPAPELIDLIPNAAQTYTVTAVIAACSNLTNTVAANWSIGNTDGTATTLDPIEDEVDVALLLEDPDISVTVPELISANYCGAIDITRTITVTNNGGAGTNLLLNLSTNLAVTSLSPDWNLTGSTLTYVGGVPVGTIRSGEVLTFSVRLQGGPFCSLNGSASLALTPVASDGCQQLTFTGGSGSASSTTAPDAPTLVVTKSAPGTAAAGDSFIYTITASGQNQQSIGAGGITVTDSLPGQLVVNAITTTNGSVVQNGLDLVWTLPADGTGSYLEDMLIDVTIPEEGAGTCNAGSTLANAVTAVADVCPECVLNASANTITYIDDYLGANNVFTKSVTPIELCGDPNLQRVTAVLNIQDGIDWSQATYTDPLGQGQFALPLNVVPGSVNVEIDGVDRTADITTTLGAPLVLEFANIGTFSATTRITITYQVTAAAGSIVGDAVSQSAYIFSQVNLGTVNACSPGGSIGYVGTTVTLHRGNLGVGVSPATLTGCTEHNVTLTVSGADVYQTDNIEVVFTADPTDIFTTTVGAVTYGGAFTGQTPTVTRVGNVVTFTFPTTLDINSVGTISFPLYRHCGVSTPLSAVLTYQDRCDITRGSSANSGATLHPNLSLFVTPDRFTVNERVAPWRFYVTNIGTGTGYNNVVTNTLPAGYYLTGYTVSSTTASPGELGAITVVTGTLGNGRQVITATIPSLSPGRRIQFDMVSELSTCTPVSQVDIALYSACGAVGGVCGGRLTDSVTFVKGTPALTSSNIQPANLPLCETGPVRIVVKNSSATSDLYNFTITDYVTRATYVSNTAVATLYNRGQIVNSSGGTPLANIPFTPTVQSFTDYQLLTWSLADFTPGSLAYEILAQRDASDEIHITFDVLSSCDSQGAVVQSSGSAQDVCGTGLSFIEDSLTLTTDEPILNATKTVRNLSEGTAASGQTFAGVGDTLLWEIQISNTGAQRVTNLFVDDQLPDGFTLQSVSPITSSQTGSPPFLRWHESGGQILNVNATATYQITTTVDADVCSLNTTNTALASYACSTTDICLSIPVTSTAQINTKPAFTLNPVNATLDQCGGGPIEVQFPNNGARAQNVVLTYTLPAGLAYNGLAAGSLPVPDSQPVPGATGTLTFTYNVIGSQATTNVLRFNVINASGVCATPGANPGNTADLSYQDTCGQQFDDVIAASNTLTIQRSDISTTSQTPVLQTVTYNQTYAWTITVPNTGNSATNNLLITETLGNGWTAISASPGTPGGAVPIIVGNVITWDVGSLAAGATWTAVFTATTLDAATDYRTSLNATTQCDDGGCLQTTPDISYNTPLQAYNKTISQTPVSIGELFTYTLTADFWGDRLYSSVLLTDTLPQLGGTRVFSVTDVAIANENSATNTWGVGALTGDTLVFTTTTPNPGEVQGPDFVTITVTGLISNELAANNNNTFTNNIDLTYTEDGQNYSYSDSVTGTIREPVLTITKVASPTSGLDAGDEITYTLTVNHLPASTAVAYDLVITDVIPAELTYKAGSLDAPGAAVTATSDQLITITYSSLPLGSSAVLTYVVTADTAVNLSDSYTNSATLTYTSTPGDNPAERTGTGGNPNDYTASDTSTITITDPAVAKTITATSLGDTAGLNVAVGEIITYAVTITVPEGTMPASQLVDTLTDGLAFIACTDITASAGVTTSIGAFTDVCTNPSVTGLGRSITFDFATITNANSNDATPETIVVTYQAVVLNNSFNDRGDVNGNSVTWSWNNGSRTAAASSVTAVEPTLTLSKIASPTVGDAADVFTFTLTIAHSGLSNAAAYDVVLADSIPTGMSYVPGSLVHVAGTAVLTSAVGSDLTVTVPTLALGESSTVQFQVILNTTARPGDIITNTANLSWTSLPGDVTTAQSGYNPVSTERTGSTGDPGGTANDYATSSSASVEMTNFAALTKSITASSLASTVAPNVAIGEIATYTVRLQVPEGTMNTAVLTDTLDPGLAIVDIVSITAPVDVTTSIGTFADVLTAARVGLAVPGRQAVYNFGTIVNSNGDNLTTEYIDITYQAVVINSAANNRGTTLNNAVTFTWDTGSATAVSTDVVIVEPTLAIAKTVTPISGDAGDTITYTLTINHAAASDSDAYDVVITDLIPGGMTYVPGSVEDVSGTAATSLNENAGQITAAWDTLPDGAASTIRFRVTLDTAVQPGDTFLNTANLTWTSLPGDVTTAQSAYDTTSTERTGNTGDPGGAANDYASSANSPLVTMTNYPVLAKALIATNLADSTGLNVAIGEILTYQVVITVPEGTLNTARLTDTLQTGLAAVSITSITASPGLSTSIGTFADVRTNANGSLASPGETIAINFGNLTNANTDNAFAETITITYEAVVLNTVGNNRGNTRVNDVDFTWATGSNNAAAAAVTIIEPELTLTKTAVPDTGDAGDTITFTLVIDHAAASDSVAYNLVLTDVIPSGMTYVNGSLEDVSGTAATSLIENSGILTATWDTLTTAQTSTIRFRVTLDDSVQPGETITNNARLSWTSLPGDVTTPQSGVNTSSVERTGSGIAPDDYTTSASDAITLHTPTITKVQPVPAQYTIGDTITYNILVTLTEGTIQDLVIFDNLPAGLAYQSHTVITTAGAPGSLLIADYNGSALTPGLTNGGGSGDDVTLSFGTVTTAGDNNSGNNSYQVQITAVVLDITLNQQGDTRTNSAELRYTDANAVPQTVGGGSVNVTLIEPQITTVKTVTPLIGVEAGDTVTYTVTFTNTGDSPAYEVVATDTLAQGVLFGTVVSCVDQTATPVSTAVTDNTSTVDFTGAWDIPVGGSVTCVYTAVAQPNLYLNGDHINTIDADWSSQDGTANLNDRNYTDTGTHNVDGSQDVDTAVFTADAITFTKTDSTVTATLGDTVNYTLTVVAPLGTLRNLVIQDVLPAGLIYNVDQAISGIATVPTVTVSTPNDGSVPVTISWDFGDAVVTNNTIELTYSATVANVLSNQQGDTITNTATLTYNNAQNVPQTPLTDTDNVTIVEPVLTIAKTIATPATPPDAGGTVIYQIVVQHDGSSDVDAYDVVISDTLPAALINARSVNVTASGISAPSGEAVGALVRVPAAADGSFDLPFGAVVTITFAADIAGSVAPNQIVTNTAHTTWSTQNGTTNTNERISGDGLLNGGTLNDYEVTSAIDFTASGSTIGKGLQDTSAAHTTGSNVTIGEIVTYALTVNLPEGVIPSLVITDNLPAGLAYTGDYTVVTTGFNGTISSGDPVVAPAGAGTSGEDVVFTFSQPITVTADNDPNNNAFLITLRARVLDVAGNVGVAPQSILTNNATLQIGSNPAETSPDVTVTVVEPRLVIDKQFSPAAASTEDTVVVTLVVTNTGTSDAFEVTLSDPLSAYFTNITEGTTAAGFTFDLTGGTVSYSGGTIAVSDTVTFTFTAELTTAVYHGLTIPNTVTVTQATTLPGAVSGERNEPDVQANDTLTVLAPDLAVTKDDGVTTTGPGGILTYTLTVTNNGSYTATGIVLTDTIPLNTTLLDASGAAVSGRDLTWNLLPLGASGFVTRTVTVQVDDPLAFGVTAVTNYTGVIDDGTHGVDPTPADNNDSDTDAIVAADLSLLKIASDTTPNYGDTVTFTLSVTNSGPDTATNVTVSDTLPAGLAFVSAVGGTYDDATGIWTVGTLGTGNTAVLTLTVQVNATGTLTNTAWVQAADQYDPDSTPGNNSGGEDDQDSVVLTVPPAADLSLTKSINDAQANVGDTITYTLVLTNDGPDTATGVTISDTLPAGLTLTGTSSSPGTSYAGSTWTVGTLTSGSQVTLTITASVDSNGIFDNIAQVVTANEYDIDSTPGNNVPAEDDQDNAVLDTPEIDLSLAKSVNNPTPNVGETITYTLIVANAGSDAATGVTVSDTLPAGLTFVNAATVSGSYDDATGVWTIGTITASGSAALTIAATVDVSGTITNTAWVHTAVQFDIDSTPGNNNPAEDDQGSAVITTQSADLSLGKSVSNAAPTYGSLIDYTITITNAGPDAATQVTVRDVLPAEVTFDSAAATTGSYDDATGIWTVGTVGVGNTAVLTLTVRITATTTITNIARVETSDQLDPDSIPGNDSAGEDDQDSVTVVIPPSADLSLTKVVDTAAPNIGETVRFTITLSNDGPDTATGVTVTDTLPAGLTFVAAATTAGTSYSDATGIWTVGTLTVGSHVTLTIDATLNAPGTHPNVARVETSDQHDIDSIPGNNDGAEDDQDTAVVTTQQADLSLVKTLLGTGPYQLADVITYTIVVSNAGPSTATNVVVTDTLPAGLTYRSHATSQGSYTPGGSWNVGTVALNASSTLTLVVQITASGTLTNTAAITAADQFDPDSTPGNGSTTEDDDDSVTITVADESTDWGDLPDSYGTSAASDGARHVLNGLSLGSTVDAETSGSPSLDATGDGVDEDGVVRNPDYWLPGANVTLSVSVTGGDGYLVGWIDWNDDGVMSAAEAVDFGSLTAGAHTVTVTIPGGYTMGTSLYTRFRLFDPAQLPAGSIADAVTGVARGGEVEDYYWTFNAATNVTLSHLQVSTAVTGLAWWWVWLLMVGLTVLLTMQRRRTLPR